jgi:cellulose synthase (UDP-forming)
MMLSMFCTFRYGYWRIEQVVRFFQDPANHWGALDAFFILCLLLAEATHSSFSFSATFRPSGRCAARPSRCPRIPRMAARRRADSHLQRAADVVRYTALGALNMDWPADKLHVYILDDGRRKEFEQFAFEAGIGYKTRPDNKHAKAGNINTALQTMTRRWWPSSTAITCPRAAFCR